MTKAPPPDVVTREAFVEFRSVSKTYDGRTMAVDGLNLAIGKGEFLTLLGPSGSGKTTALMMLAGFETPTSGEILLAGRSLARLPPHRRNMGVVFQSYALFPHMTVAENIAFPLTVRRLPSAQVRERVERALQLVQLSGFGDRRPAELSGGQQQRVALARAIIFDPDVILMDEPLGALDKQLREQLQLEIKHIQQQLGVTVVYVTHDQSEALTMSDRIAVFDRGRIRQLASPREIYEEPANDFVAQFVGQNNRLEGTIAAVESEHCTVRMQGDLIVRARLAGTAAPGDRVSVCVRPERILLEPQPDVPNVFDARVEDLIYHGDHVRVRLALKGGSSVMLKADRSAADGLFIGTAVTIGWLVDSCRAFPPDGQT